MTTFLQTLAHRLHSRSKPSFAAIQRALSVCSIAAHSRSRRSVARQPRLAKYATQLFCGFILAMLVPAQAWATDQLAFDNSVFVERVHTDANGKNRISLEEPKAVLPGDRLIFVLNYRNASAQPASRFVVTNMLPTAVRFAGAGDSQPLVSINGGKQWGLLSELTVAMAGGTRRAAQPGDVTHIRWAFRKPVPAGGTGKLIYRGVVK